MKKVFIILSFLMIATLTVFSCKKKTTTTTPVADTGSLMLHLHTNLDTSEVDSYGTTYYFDSSRAITLNIAQLYISNVQLEKLDGTFVPVSGNGALKVMETEGVQIGSIPVGAYQSVRFNVGLSPTVNKLLPTASGYNDLLNVPAMWFNQTAEADGYVFLNVAGSIDTTAAKKGSLVPFEYKIGTDANYVQVSMDKQNLTITKDATGVYHIVIDYAKIFDGIKLSDNSNLHIKTISDNSLELVNKLKANIPKMFAYEM